jgi:hypothetical protein
MKSTQDIQKELMQLLPESKEDVIKAIKKYFPRNSSIYKSAVLLKGQLNSLRNKELKGTLTASEVQIEENKIRASLMDVITEIGKMETIEASSPNRNLLIWGTFILLFVAGIFIGWKYFNDEKPTGEIINPQDTFKIEALDTNFQRGIAAKTDKAKNPIGQILYSVPNRMQLNKSFICLIRISQAELSTLELVEKIPSESPIEMDSIRIGDVMTANIKNDDNAFKITPLSTPEQVIEEGFFTEWKFSVKPLKAGTHYLYIQATVNIKTEEYGVKSRDVLTMNKKVEVVTQAIKPDTTMQQGGSVLLASLDYPPSDKSGVDEPRSSEAEVIEDTPDQNKPSEALDAQKPETESKADKKIEHSGGKSNTQGQGNSSPDKSTGQSTKGDKVILSKNAVSTRLGGDLKDRSPTLKPILKNENSTAGVIVLRLCVDKRGKVSSAKFTSKGSTSLNPFLIRTAIANAKKWQFVRSNTDKQCGTLTYTFKAK